MKLLAQTQIPVQVPQATAPASTFHLPHVEYSLLLPEFFVIGGALLLLLFSALVVKRNRTTLYTWFTLITLAAASVPLVYRWHEYAKHAKAVAKLGPAVSQFGSPVVAGPATRGVEGAIANDGFGIFLVGLLLAIAFMAILIGDGWLRREKQARGPEFHVLVLLATSGAMIMAVGNDLIVTFLGLEILSLPLFVLAAFHSRRALGREAAMKYFILSAFSSALFLYGVALTYGSTGSTNLDEIGSFLSQNVATSGVLLAGVALLLIGFGFKVAAVPFHTWAPDVYQGSPSPVSGFMAAAAKVGAFAGMLRVFMTAFSTLRLDWQPLVAVLAVLSLIVGAVMAAVQTDVKRMMAYSSISHAGFMLVGLQAGTTKGVASVLEYVAIYSFMLLGAFAVITVAGGPSHDVAQSVDDYRGFARKRPGLALLFTIFLLAQAGVPLTGGFIAKFSVIAAAVDAKSYALAILAMLSAVVAAFLYLRIVLAMYAGAGDEADDASVLKDPALRPSRAVAVALGIALVVTVASGVLPGPALDLARHATLAF
ncbi:MAG: NADH-quinone oxidoreductase subunit [Actinomycetota bacterium]|jgi:NADH-quinone oxidoreductase subunit N